jgi:hypothetical protein
MKKFFLLFILLSVKEVLLAQDYYINNSGDTVKGTVNNYKQWDKNPATISFHTNNNEVILNPLKCKEIVINQNDRYISYSGTRIINPEKVTNFSEGPENGIIKKDTVSIFLRDIYHYKNYVLYKFFDRKRNNFYISKNGEVSELEYYESIIENRVGTYDGYKAILNEVLSGEGIADLNEKLKKVTYDETELINFISGTLKDYVNSSEKKRNIYPKEYLIGTGAIANIASLNFSNSAFISDKTSISPFFEIGVRLYNQRKFGRPFFQSVISFIPIKSSFLNNVGMKYDISLSLISAYLSSGYMFIKNDKLSVYGAAGLGILIAANLKNEYQNTITNYGTYTKIGIRPELGILISHKLNVSLFATAPFKFPAGPAAYKSNIYKITQAGLAVRYIIL